MKESIIKLAMKVYKNKYPIIGATAIITNSKKQVLLAKRTKNHVTYPNYWNLPGGIIEFGEEVEHALKREVKEEIGVDIKIGKFIGHYYRTLPNPLSPWHTMSLPFHCKILRGTPKPKDETTEVKWFTKNQIKKMKLAYTHKQILKDEGLA